MGVIVKYQIAFPEAGLTVSNDPFAGDFLLDADVTVRMDRGAAGSSFEVAIQDLPLKKAEALRDKLGTAKLGTVVVKLGYMDGAFERVVEGLFSGVKATVQGDKLVTAVSGMEVGTHALQRGRPREGVEGKQPLADALAALLRGATIAEGRVDRSPVVQGLAGETVEDQAFRGRKLLEVIDDIARNHDAELLVTDGVVRVGRPVRDDGYAAKPFDPLVNLARFVPFDLTVPGEDGENRLAKLDPKKALGFDFVIAGDPKLRPGQRVATTNKGFEKADGEFRVSAMTHRLSMTDGYVCQGRAIRVCEGAGCRQAHDRLAPASAESVAAGLADRTRTEPQRRPTLEIGQVKEYRPGSEATAGHRGTLYFGQTFPRSETQPSVRAAVQTDAAQVMRNKPIASPFAWHKCGLVVPVYPGMRAVLGHNLNLPDDAIAVGFMWADEPRIAPPASKVGDWWLCLPVDYDGAAPPADGTKAANDLTANDGRRVIEVRGLRVTVGADTLGPVGVRPAEGDANEFLIEHQSGTAVRIAADGSLTLKAASVTIEGDLTVKGKVDIQ